MGYKIMSTLVADVGQGQCTFIKLFDSNEKLVETLLFDCGSDKRSDPDTTINLKAIAASISDMDDPQIGCIFFSHSDKDHISLTKELLGYCTKKPVVNQVYYCGAYSKYTKKDFNILEYLEEEEYCEKDNINGLAANVSNINADTGNYTDYLWRSGTSSTDVVVRCIAGNVDSSEPDWNQNGKVLIGKKAEELNQVSLVAGLYYRGLSMVICGDATHVTMSAVNGRLKNGTTQFNQNIMLTLPHHGSRLTALNAGKNVQASENSIKNVKTFSANMKAMTITVSANEKHSHPSLELINLFVPRLVNPLIKDPRLNAANAHQIAVFQDVNLKKSNEDALLKGVYYTFATKSNVFTTRYQDTLGRAGGDYSYELGNAKVKSPEGVIEDAVINQHASWVYDILPNNVIGIGGYANLASDRFTKVVGGDLLRSAQREAPEFTESLLNDSPASRAAQEETVPLGVVSRSRAIQSRTAVNTSSQMVQQFF